jgi:acyl-CoA reductase-like NAD-dependent aldehyde dehydrogenase
MLTSLNPATEEILKEYHEHDQDEINRILQQGREAFRQWQYTGFSYRSELTEKM